jgi:hypothetical protein
MRVPSPERACALTVEAEAPSTRTDNNCVGSWGQLESHRVVQPFAWLIRMPPDLYWLNPADIDVSVKWEEGGLVPFRQVTPCCACGSSRGVHRCESCESDEQGFGWR